MRRFFPLILLTAIPGVWFWHSATTPDELAVTAEKERGARSEELEARSQKLEVAAEKEREARSEEREVASAVAPVSVLQSSVPPALPSSGAPALRPPAPRRSAALLVPVVLASDLDRLDLSPDQRDAVEALADYFVEAVGTPGEDPENPDPAFVERVRQTSADIDHYYRAHHGHRAWVQLQLRTAQQLHGN